MNRLIMTWVCMICLLCPAAGAGAAVYRVGPGQEYSQVEQVPFDSLEPGDQVNIYYRKAPYRARIVLRRSGTADRPIVIRGIPHKGKRPVLDGRMAVLFQKEVHRNPGEFLIKIGDDVPADYIHIQNLTIRNANNTEFTLENDQKRPYTENAAGFRIIKGRHVTISNCLIHSCGNGILTWHAPAVSHMRLTRSILIDNGNHADPKGYLEHNAYLGGARSIVEFCYFGKPHSNGQNLKDRGQDTIIRYNWIEGGKNRQLDLVEYKGYRQADAFVYGNVVIQGTPSQNHDMIFFGGEKHSRSGTLYLFNNTIVAYHPQTRYINVSRIDCRIDIRNNVFVGSGRLWSGKGALFGANNWFSSTITYPSRLVLGMRGNTPGFPTATEKQYRYIPLPGSNLINAGTSQTPLPVEFMPKLYGSGMKRPAVQGMDIGAFEYHPGMKINR